MIIILFLITSVIAIPCNVLLPSMFIMIAGYDKTNADIRAMPYPIKQPIILLTCNNGKKYLDPYTNITYDWPDQVSNIVPIGGSQLDIFTFIKDTTHDYELGMNVEETESINYIIGSYSQSTTIQSSLHVFINEYRSLGIAKSTIYAYAIFLKPANMLNISNELQYYIDTHLTPVLIFNEKSVDIYNTLFTTFGTDFNQHGSFGGEACYLYACLKSLYYKESSMSIQTDASNSLFNIISKAGGANGQTKSVNSNYIASTTFNMQWRGGMPTFINFAQWSNTVPRNPAPLEINLQSISQLFSNQLLQTNIDVARINYLDSSLLKNEILSSLFMFTIALNTVVKQTGICIYPSSCQVYPSYPSCGTHVCPGNCPDTHTYCGANVQCCTSHTDPTYYTNQVNKIIKIANTMKSDIINLQNEITNVLKSSILNHTIVQDIYNKYLAIMLAIETPIVDFNCDVQYKHSDFTCEKWSKITSSQCSSSAKSIATSCPYANSLTTYATFAYFKGMLTYN
jgi:hypothetical protein